MELIKLRDLVVENKIPKLVILEGTELDIIDIYINEIGKTLNKEYVSFPSVLEYFNATHIKSLFKKNIEFAVIRGDETFLKEKSLWNIADNIKGNIILTYSSLDKNKEFVDRFKDNIYQAQIKDVDIKVSLLLKLKKAGMEISEKYISWLINNCNSDYGRCVNELDKVLIFKNDIRSAEEIFKQFARDGAFHYDIPDCVFDFADAFLDRDRKKVFDLYEDLKGNGEQPMVILTVLYNNIRNLLLVQGARNPTPENTLLKDFIIRKLKYKVKNYSTVEIMNALLLLCELNKQVKIGQIDDRTAVEYFMIKTL